jgi:hypothetical protein
VSSAPAPARRRFPWPVYLVVLAVIVVLAALPVLSVTLAGVLASANGCRLDEGGAHPCVIAGTDYGDTLYTLGVLGWLMLVSLPLGVVALLVWAVVLGSHLFARSRRP